jgi:hypothetical protein
MPSSIGSAEQGFRLSTVRLVIRPTPDPGVRAAIHRAVEASDSLLVAPLAYRSRWRKAGLDYAAARRRRRRGATRA